MRRRLQSGRSAPSWLFTLEAPTIHPSLPATLGVQLCSVHAVLAVEKIAHGRRSPDILALHFGKAQLAPLDHPCASRFSRLTRDAATGADGGDRDGRNDLF